MKIIPFYGRTIQVSELLGFTQTPVNTHPKIIAMDSSFSPWFHHVPPGRHSSDTCRFGCEHLRRPAVFQDLLGRPGRETGKGHDDADWKGREQRLKDVYVTCGGFLPRNIP